MRMVLPDEMHWSLKRLPNGNFDVTYTEEYTKGKLTKKEIEEMLKSTRFAAELLLKLLDPQVFDKIMFTESDNGIGMTICDVEPRRVVSMMKAEIMANDGKMKLSFEHLAE